eukprot:6060404-Alexandrium_andersonii.AAC.1
MPAGQGHNANMVVAKRRPLADCIDDKEVVRACAGTAPQRPSAGHHQACPESTRLAPSEPLCRLRLPASHAKLMPGGHARPC